MSRIRLFAADVLLIAAGLAWAYIAGAQSIVIARDGWPPAPIGVALMVIPFIGIIAEFALIGLAAIGRYYATVLLSTTSLLAALVLFGLQFSGKFIGYK